MPTAGCSPDTVACELRRIADAQSAWDWNSFASTLIAALLGAAVATGGVMLVAQQDRRERARTKMTEVATDLMLAVSAYSRARAAWHRIPGPRGRAPAPDRTQYLVALRVAQTWAGSEGSDFATFSSIYDVLLSAERHDAPEDQGEKGYMEAVDELMRWRSGVFLPTEVRDDARAWLAYAEPPNLNPPPGR